MTAKMRGERNFLISELRLIRRAWLAIDPKRVIGDPAYEAAGFKRNPVPRFLLWEKPSASVMVRSAASSGTESSR
jgi:streptomycin 6-kinase